MNEGIFVLGSTGPTGEILVRDLCAAGQTVWVMHRTDQRRKEFAELGAKVLLGDAMDRDSVFSATANAAAECSTVVNLIGGDPTQPPVTWADGEGNMNSIDAAADSNFSRYIFVTSVGTGSSWRHVPEDAFTRPIL
jgi:nucleoside-diphosphate-sugar epimerase